MPNTDQSSTTVLHLDRSAIEKLVQHRGPALRLDAAIFDPQTPDRIRGLRTITADCWDLVGHFPEEPVLPGVLTTESAYLAAAVLVRLKFPDFTGRPAIRGNDQTRYNAPVYIGDTLVIEVTFLKHKMRMFFLDAQVLNQNGLLVATVSNIVGTQVG